MAIFKINPQSGIDTISGAISRQRLADGSVRAWVMTKKGRIFCHTYKRTKPLSNAEIAARNIFKEASLETKRRIEAGDTRRRAVIFKEVYAQLKQA